MASSRKRLVIGNVLIGFTSAVLFASAAAKLFIPKVSAEFASMGIDGGRLAFIAMLETLSTALLLIKSSRSFGVLMISAFMGGAIATHLQHGQSILPPAAFLTLIWLGVWLRHREILWSASPGAYLSTGSAAASPNYGR